MRRSETGAGRPPVTRLRRTGRIYYNEDSRICHMPNPLLTKIVAKHHRQVPEFRPGDTIRVHVKIREGDKERLQAFEGTVIARKNEGLGETVTVRKISFGQGVERIFPIHAPVIDHIDVVGTGRGRRPKLYYCVSSRAKQHGSASANSFARELRSVD